MTFFHKCLFDKKINHLQCETYNVQINIQHLITEYAKYSNERIINQIPNNLAESLQTKNEKADSNILNLLETNLYKEI